MQSHASIGVLDELSETFKTSRVILEFGKVLIYNKKEFVCFLTNFKVGVKLKSSFRILGM